MKSIKIIFVFIFIGNLFQTNAQRTSDLGFIYGSSDLYRMNLEYRKPIKEKSRLKFGLSIGSANSPSFNYSSQIREVTDSLIVSRNYTQSSFQFTLKSGFERQIKTSMFSYGVDILFGYKERDEGYYQTKEVLTPEGSWANEELFTFTNYETDPLRSLRTTKYIVPGLQLNFSMDIPIEDRLFLHLFVSQILTSPIYLSEKIIQNPLNEFPNYSKSYIINSQNQIGIGLRYKFKK